MNNWINYSLVSRDRNWSMSFDTFSAVQKEYYRQWRTETGDIPFDIVSKIEYESGEIEAYKISPKNGKIIEKSS